MSEAINPQSKEDAMKRGLRKRVAEYLHQCAVDTRQETSFERLSGESDDAYEERIADLRKHSDDTPKILSALFAALSGRGTAQVLGADDQAINLNYGVNAHTGFTEGWPANSPFKHGDRVLFAGGGHVASRLVPLPPTGELFLRALEKFLVTGELVDDKILSGEQPFLADAAGLLPDDFVVSLRTRLASATTFEKFTEVCSVYGHEWTAAMAEARPQGTDGDVFTRYMGGQDVFKRHATELINRTESTGELRDFLLWQIPQLDVPTLQPQLSDLVHKRAFELFDAELSRATDSKEIAAINRRLADFPFDDDSASTLRTKYELPSPSPDDDVPIINI